MAERTIRSGIGTYQRPDGIWTHGMLGDVVDVHKDDVDRFDRLNPAPVEAPVEESEDAAERAFPEGDPVEAWTNNQLDAYAAEHGFDVSAAKSKKEKLAIFAG